MLMEIRAQALAVKVEKGPEKMRISLGLIAFAYVTFGAILLLAPSRYDASTNTFRYDSDPTGIPLFALFGVALIAHLAVAVISRSLLYWLGAVASALFLCYLFFWVLHKVTGDSL
jgi:hypothetical protein